MLLKEPSKVEPFKNISNRKRNVWDVNTSPGESRNVEFATECF